jgi:hypothetical protein
MTMHTKLLKTGFLSVLFILTACTSVPEDGGIAPVQELLDARVDPNNPATRLQPENALSPEDVAALLSKPLASEDAELLSMQLNPQARRNLLRVGIAEADYAQAGRIRNPGFTYERNTDGEYSTSLLFDIGGLLLMPLRREVTLRQLEAARYEAAGSVIDHLADTRIAWIEAITEQQLTRLVERSLETAVTANDMTRQMAALGHSGVSDSGYGEIPRASWYYRDNFRPYRSHCSSSPRWKVKPSTGVSMCRLPRPT